MGGLKTLAKLGSFPSTSTARSCSPVATWPLKIPLVPCALSPGRTSWVCLSTRTLSKFTNSRARPSTLLWVVCSAPLSLRRTRGAPRHRCERYPVPDLVCWDWFQYQPFSRHEVQCAERLLLFKPVLRWPGEGCHRAYIR